MLGKPVGRCEDRIGVYLFINDLLTREGLGRERERQGESRRKRRKKEKGEIGVPESIQLQSGDPLPNERSRYINNNDR